MTYKELWEKNNSKEFVFDDAECRDLEFNLNTDCSGNRCKDCWNEQVPESEDKDESNL